MPRVGLVFDLRHCQTQPGESLCVRGNVERLGAWSAEGRDDSLRLHTDHKRYPRWSSRAPIWLEAEALPEEDFKFSFRYKYVKDRRCFCDKPYGRSAFVWEGSISDRCICLPVQDGAVFLVSDEIWDEEGQTIITQLRRSKVHMPTTLQPQDNCSFVLSPRAREKEEEDTQFPIEIEFGALDVEPKVETKYTFMEKQAEALKLENVVLRKRLQNLEAAMSNYPVDMTDSTDITDDTET
ncbi:unnamed protein product [Durusdinium trenchii]|uniref:Uncharacterized protein n=2 Tax=Durusdinium trenchii TaxID=1381693 RepID=A0ABP0P1E0_9DINO